MVTIERHGQRLLHDCGIDSNIAVRAAKQALPYCLKRITKFLLVSPAHEYDLSGDVLKTKQKPNPRWIEEKELLDMIPCPFPKDSIISAMLSRVLGSSQVVELPSLKDGLLIADLPLVDLYIEDCKKRCTYSICTCSDESLNCKVNY